MVRNPPRASSTASAVPNEPAPITVARFAPGVGSESERGPRALGLAATVVLAGPPELAGVAPSLGAPGVAVGSGSII